MKNSSGSFSYKSGNSFVHRIPAIVKILWIPVMSVVIFNLPWQVSAVLIVVQLAIQFSIRFRFSEIISDIRPILYYAAILYVISFIGRFCGDFFSGIKDFIPSPELGVIGQVNVDAGSKVDWNGLGVLAGKAALDGLKKVFGNLETPKMLLKLFCAIQTASIVFKTTSSLQIKDGIGKIEIGIRRIFRKEPKIKVAQMVSLFICFIPLVFRNWQQCKRTWVARGGKRGIKMLFVIMPVFFSVGIKQAYSTSRAIMIRS